MTSRRRAFAVVLLVGLVLAACGGDDDDEQGPGTTEAAAFDPNGVVRSGYDLIASQRGGAPLDPTKQLASSADEGLYYAIYGRLLRPTQDGGVEPDLAEEATLVDANTIDIVVREGLTWHDGKPFDAESVKAGLDYLLANGTESAFTTPFFSAESVEVTAPNTVQVKIPDGTAASWYDFLGLWNTTIVRPGDDFTKPVGAGPMRVVEFAHQESMVLEKFEDYWDADAITVAGVELVNIVSEANEAALGALRNGQVDVALSDVERLPALTGDLKPYLRAVDSRLTHLMVCKAEGPLSEVNARKAISRAIDREAVVRAVFGGTGEGATQVWPEGHRFFNPDVADEMAYDPESIPELLEEAGLADGFSFDAYVLQSASMPALAEVMKQQLAEHGITLNIVPSPNYVSDFLEPDKPGLGVVPALPGDKVAQWVGDQLSNVCNYNDPELNDLNAKLRTVSLSSDEAAEYWQEIARIVAEDALSIPIHFGSNIAGYSTDRLAAVALWPVGQIVFPDLRETKVKAST